MRTDIAKLNEIATGLIDGTIETNNLEENLASHQGLDLNNEMDASAINDIIHDLVQTGIIEQQENGYNVIDADIFINDLASDIGNIAYATEEISHDDGTTHTRVTSIDEKKAIFEWNDFDIKKAENSNFIEFDFRNCEGMEYIMPQLYSEMVNSIDANGECLTALPIDKEILVLQGDTTHRIFNETEFKNDDVVIFNGFAYTYNEELNGFIKSQIAIDTTLESAIESQIPSSIKGYTVYLSQDIADKVQAGVELTPEDEEQIIVPNEDEPEKATEPKVEDNNPTKEGNEPAKENDSPEKEEKTGPTIRTNSPDFVDTVYKTNSKYYTAAHPGDTYEEGIADKLNEIEQRRIESETKINQLRNEIREAKKAMNQGPFFVKMFRAVFFKPIRGIFRFLKRLLGKEINYSQCELDLKSLKEELKREQKNAILIDREQKDYSKVHGIEVDKSAVPFVAPVVEEVHKVDDTRTTTEPQTEIPETGEGIDTKQPKAPNVTQIFAQTLSGICNNYQMHINAYSEKDAEGKFKTALELTTPNGEVAKFHYDTNKGILNPVSFSVEQPFPEAVIADIQKKAYIAHTIATAIGGKMPVSEKSAEYINKHAIAPLLNGEKTEAEFKFGNIPVEIKTEGGLYKLSFNPDKENGTKELELHITAESLSPENLQATLNGIKITHALTMYKSYTNEQFLDFVQNSEVINGIKNVSIDNMQKCNNDLTFDVTLPDAKNNNDMTVTLTLSTETFSISGVSKETEAMMTPSQKNALGKIASRLEEAYASFIFSKSKVPVGLVMPSQSDLIAKVNGKIQEVNQGEKESFFAYGLKMEVNKENEQYPSIRISTKENIVLKDIPLYEQELTLNDVESFYGEIAKGLQISASKYDKVEAALLNNQSKEVTVGDAVLDENLADFSEEYDNSSNAISDEIDIINNIESTIAVTEDRY